MTDHRCRFVATDQPRVLRDRHLDECAEDGCGGCLPCPDPHCVICTVNHSLGACPACVGEVRDELAEIARMCSDLPTEASHRGVNSEAMNLLGPAADSEARQHWEASVLAGRIVPVDCDAHDLADVKRWLETADDARHPLLVLNRWAVVYRDAFEHDEPLSRVEIPTEADYLSRNLTYMATYLDVPFADFASDLRSCLAHIKVVLHDQDYGERANVACFDCDSDLERKLGDGGFDDAWTCRGCRRRYTIAEYNFALRARLEESA